MDKVQITQRMCEVLKIHMCFVGVHFFKDQLCSMIYARS